VRVLFAAFFIISTFQITYGDGIDHAARIDSLEVFYGTDSTNIPAFTALIDEYLLIGDINTAESLLIHYMATYKADSRILYSYGKLNDLKENLPKAIDYYHKAIEKDPSFWKPYLGLAYLFDITLQYDSMNIYLSRAITCSPFPESLNYDYGYSFDLMGQTDSALSYYYRAFLSDSLDYQAAMNIGAIWGSFGRYDSARYYTERSLKSNPNIPEALYNYAEILSYYSEFESAISQYQAALAIDPSNFGIHKRLGELYDKVGDSLTAEIHFEEFIKAAPPFYDSDIREVKARLKRIPR
jgi:tetratricopeptide (TPR) repeat protein